MLTRKSRKAIYWITAVPLVFIGVFFYRPWEDESILDFVVEWLGYLFIIAGTGLRMWSTLYIGTHKSLRLITDGPYSICRNPLYLGTFSVMIGMSLCFENLVLLAAILLIVFPIHFFVISAEEKHLAEIFGTAYEEYKKKVPRFGFAFSNFNSPDRIEVSTHAIYRTTRDAVIVLLIPVLGDLVEILHANGTIPVLWKF